jgi:hypothetical protein
MQQSSSILAVVLSKKYDLKDRKTQRKSLVQLVLRLATAEHKFIALPLYKLTGLTPYLFADIPYNNHLNGDTDTERCNKNIFVLHVNQDTSEHLK